MLTNETSVEDRRFSRFHRGLTPTRSVAGADRRTQVMARLVLQAETLIDGSGAPAVRDAEIVIERDRIVRLGTAEAKHDPNDHVVDYGKATLLPGLIDSHVHLQFNAASTNEEVVAAHINESEAELYERSVSNARAGLRSGSTTIRDCGGHLEPSMAVRDDLASGKALGPRLVAAGAPITTRGGHLHWCGMIADSVEEVCDAVRKIVDAGADFIKVMATGGGMTPISDMRRPQYSRKVMSTLVETAHELGKPVAAHALAADGCEITIDTGVDNIEHFFWLSESGFDYRPEAVSRMDPSRQTINATYFGPDRDGFANYEHIDDVPKDALLALRNKYWFYREAADAGLMVTSSSDAGVRDTPFDGFALTVIAGMIAMDDTPVGAIYRATLAPARAIGRDDELGSLERGKVADVFRGQG